MNKLSNPPKSKRLTKKVVIECLAILNEIDHALFDNMALWRPDMWMQIGIASKTNDVNAWLHKLHDRIIDARANLNAWHEAEKNKSKRRKMLNGSEK